MASRSAQAMRPLVHDVALEGPGADFLLLLLPHGGPDVGVDDVGAAGRLARVGGDVMLAELLVALQDLGGSGW